MFPIRVRASCRRRGRRHLYAFTPLAATLTDAGAATDCPRIQDVGVRGISRPHLDRHPSQSIIDWLPDLGSYSHAELEHDRALDRQAIYHLSRIALFLSETLS